ncbi:type ISP restriction/modification enzyme [Corynebacterium pygosceleis]|uniref:type ISP restriction/modification enzyme n=1 Tax=Corynebacterium pygosceleis TaxID=2800406 RepID=UPI00249EC7D6|nr:type ISP restriction/modification enzyme [Corynebacterium pygosceleis]
MDSSSNPGWTVFCWQHTIFHRVRQGVWATRRPCRRPPKAATSISRVVVHPPRRFPELPPTPSPRERFDQLTEAGRTLMDLHVNYEDVDPYPVNVQVKKSADPDDRETWRVTKMKWAKKKDPETGKNVNDTTTIIYSPKVTVSGISEEAERYLLGSRSALGWIIDRYQVKKDKASGIVNDPNDWCDEVANPRYIVDLIAKVTRVAVETVRITDSLR